MPLRAPRFILLAAALFTGAAHASEFRLAVGGWHFTPTGTITDAGIVYDLQRDLATEPRGQRLLQFEWDSPPGWWPDLAVAYAQIGAAGHHEDPGMPPLVPATTVVTDADNHDYDLTLRYPFHWMDFDLSAGLTLKYVTADVVIDDSNQPQPNRTRFNQVFPQAHLGLSWPLTRVLVLSAVGEGVKYQDDSAWEVRAVAGLLAFDPVSVALGWQQKRYKIDVGESALDARLRGLLLMIGLRFTP